VTSRAGSTPARDALAHDGVPAGHSRGILAA